MIYSWNNAIKSTGQLTVYDGISKGPWATVFKVALESFNKNSGLTMKMVRAQSKESANIVMMLAGSDVFGSNGSLAHGKTRMFRDAASGEIQNVEVYLPEQPTMTHPNYLRFITVHELVHACGLDNGEHSDDGVFITLPNFSNGKIRSTKTGKPMPPLFFNGSTRAKLSKAW